MGKRAKDTLVRSPSGNGGGQDVQKDLHSRTGRDEKKGKTQDKMERGSRKRSSSVGSEKMERVGGRQEKMEGHCLTSQSPQWAVAPMEEEEEYIIIPLNFTAKLAKAQLFFSRSLCLCRKFFKVEYKHIKSVGENSDQTQKLCSSNIKPR